MSRELEQDEALVIKQMGETWRSFKHVAEMTGVRKARVREIVRRFANEGYCDFGPLWSEDDHFLRGRGYCLSPHGERLKESADVRS